MSVLLPKFASQFPERTEAAMSSIIKLSCLEPSDENEASLVEACCQTAWDGLGRLCVAAAQAQRAKALNKAIEHLLR